jgi:hypothetical protein
LRWYGIQFASDIATLRFVGQFHAVCGRQPGNKVMLLQNNANHDWLSNQTLGGLPVGTANLGSSPQRRRFQRN